MADDPEILNDFWRFINRPFVPMENWRRRRINESRLRAALERNEFVQDIDSIKRMDVSDDEATC